MSRNERRVWLYLIFLEQFYKDGHFGMSEPVYSAIIDLKAAYHSNMGTVAEYTRMMKVVDRIVNVLNGNAARVQAMMAFAAEVSGRFMAHASGRRRAAWQQMYEAISESDKYKKMLRRVPTGRDIDDAEQAAEIFELFETTMRDEGVV